MKKKIKDLTYDEFLKVCDSCHQDIVSGKCIGCPFGELVYIEDNCNWIHNLVGNFNKFINVLEQEIEVEQ